MIDFQRFSSLSSKSGGKKLEISAFFETKKFVFLRRKVSNEKNFFSQDNNTITLLFDTKSFLIEANEVQLFEIRGGCFF